MVQTRYHVVFADDQGDFISTAIANSVPSGNLVSTVRRYDGLRDLALIDVAQDDCEDFEQILDDNDSVLEYRTSEPPEAAQ